MKSFAAFSALVSLSFATAALHADPITATLGVGSHSTAVVLIETAIPGGETFAYTDNTVNLLSRFPPSLQVTDQTFEATYTDIAGVSLLNVTDVCAHADVNAASAPCQALAFSFTDASLGNAVKIAALGTVGVNLSGNVADINFGASIGGGSAEIGFPGGGDGGGGNSPVPEPGTLSLMATGLLSAAGIVRKRYLA